MKMNVFWVIMACSLVEVYRRFRGACCLHHQVIALMMEVADTETSVNYQTTRCNNPEDSHLEESKGVLIGNTYIFQTRSLRICISLLS
jgi:hypothetical protein